MSYSNRTIPMDCIGDKNMEKKILGICVCVMLIMTAIPAVGSLKNYTKHPTIPSSPLASMAGNWTQKQKILPSDGEYANTFGWAVALSGNTALIGAPYDNDSGALSGSAYVFIRTGTTWTQQAKLLASDGAAGDWFGWTVALDNDTALIAAPQDDDNGVDSGSAYVFIRTGTTWTQQAKLLASDGAAGDLFSEYAVAVKGDTALIGAQGDNDNGNYSGSAYVFTRAGTVWTQQQKLLPSDGAAGDWFGWSVALWGNTALIGARGDDDNGVDSGSAYVFIRTGTTWTQQAKLLAGDGTTGDNFGESASLVGNNALIGAFFDDNSGAYAGSAYVFIRTGTTWTQQAKLLATDGAPGDVFGIHVSLTGDNALIGAYGNSDNGSNSGSAYIFTRTGTTWTQKQKLLASDGTAGDLFGYSVSLDGNTALIGAPQDDDNGIDSGSAYIFTKTDLTFNITGGFGVHLKITNNGLTTVTGVPWSIHVVGGIFNLINITVNGTVNIPAGGTIIVGTGIFFGLGPLAITGKVADEVKTATGTQFIIFTTVI
jgi:hypothetical protein